MTKAKPRIKFLATRILTGTAAVSIVVSLWAGIALTEPAKWSATAGAGGTAASTEVVEQDGWRWDPAKNDWVLIEPAAAAEAAAVAAAPAPIEQIVIVERQPIVYQYKYVQDPSPTAARPAAAAGGGVAQGGGTAAANPQPATGGAAAPPVAAAASAPEPAAPPLSAGPGPVALPPAPAPVAPAPAPAPAAAAPPKPAPAPAPKPASKAS